MASETFRFEDFHLDPADRQLRRGDERVELSGRYLDALELMVRERGRLVSKDRFMDEVWRGIPVTDEALTQCIRTLRRQLGDDAARPRFIETVPKHGYRFIAPVQQGGGEGADAAPAMQAGEGAVAMLTLAGTAGGAVAGLLGGLFYGFAAAADPVAPGTGAASVLLVVLAITILVAVIGAAGVSLGIAAATRGNRSITPWSTAGGAAGGLVVGALVELLGLDAFNLLFGRSPADVTGALEGLILGGAVGLGAWLGTRSHSVPPVRRSVTFAALIGAAVGVAIIALGGRLLGGSLDLLARTFPGSRLVLDPLGAFFGESSFGAVTQLVTGGLEGALFASCVVGAMLLARRKAAARQLPLLD